MLIIVRGGTSKRIAFRDTKEHDSAVRLCVCVVVYWVNVCWVGGDFASASDLID